MKTFDIMKTFEERIRKPFDDGIKKIEYPILLKFLTKKLNKARQLTIVEGRLNEIKSNLSEAGKKRLNRELKETGRSGKLFTEIHILYKFAILNFKTDKPEEFDILSQNNSKKYNIEVYQPDKSRCKWLNKLERRIPLKFYRKFSGTTITSNGYSSPINAKNLLKDIISGSIEEKKQDGQLSRDKSGINILWTDLSHRRLIERLCFNKILLDFYDLNDIKTLLDKWDVLDGFILSVWANFFLTEKIGILLHRDFDKKDIDVLNQVAHLIRII